MSSKITKIILTIGNKEIALTPEEVRDLKQALEEMYQSPKERVYVNIPDYLRPYKHPIERWWNDPYCLKTTAGSVSLSAE